MNKPGVLKGTAIIQNTQMNMKETLLLFLDSFFRVE